MTMTTIIFVLEIIISILILKLSYEIYDYFSLTYLGFYYDFVFAVKLLNASDPSKDGMEVLGESIRIILTDRYWRGRCEKKGIKEKEFTEKKLNFAKEMARKGGFY